ncbi:MAG: hypothetical protein COZ34_03670 [Candidatus Pacebacteria bacterium CG_4_10_14_3_um_filter_34_15]|nr:MAG: hypothetical protein AUJ41_02060 [Candidatus Pacebacteria bacterium CG1_02_43_31]PIQ81414.1 MAG: hypothetical protein COV78_00425 [Candidatus Pacebacteria bacterium CG11_big_fil_rev_8_21_14_0_20_34_55]PIX81357.1 MAG: hypothetical protein COZ34_03670 [Candidatus Pacebacteria bacterium CG_4_10_14_3_um_filter_34_15]
MFFTAIALFWVLPFLTSIIFPATVIPLVVSWIMNRKKKTVPSIGWFVLFLVLGGLIAYFFWIFCIRDVLYHEWDPGFEAFYSFFGREPISLNGHGSWIATGWKE